MATLDTKHNYYVYFRKLAILDLQLRLYYKRCEREGRGGSPTELSKRNGASRTSSILVRQTDDGLHLANTILWFDSLRAGDLSFLSSAISPEQARVPNVIATEETIRILEAFRKKPNALVCQYNRPFSIGRLKMELLPSGCVLGGASLYVETDQGRLLYAPQLQPHRIPTVRQMQLKKASTLILGAHHPDPLTPLPNRKKERERLLDAVFTYMARGRCPVITCEPIAAAQELTKMFTDEGLAVGVHDTIYRVNKVYESFGSKLGPYSRIPKRPNHQKIVLLPHPARRVVMGSEFLGAPSVLLSVVSHLDNASHGETDSYLDRFVLSASCDGPEIKEVVSLVAPRELYIFGAYAKRYVEVLSDHSTMAIKPLFVNDQPTLF